MAVMDSLAIWPALFALGFPAFLIFSISRLSGWDKLAARYPLAGAAPKALTIFGYGTLRRWIGYNGGLIIAADEMGLYVSTWPVFLSWCHRPVFIPWKAVAGVHARKTLLTLYYRLELRESPEIDFALRAGDFSLVRVFLEKAGVPVVELTA